MMSTSSHSKAENGVIQSSIGLLQERFRQLQRMKEMRENKELLRMFSDYNNRNTNTNTNTNTSTSSTNVSPIIGSVVSNTSYTTSSITSTTTTATISGSTPRIDNMNSMQYNDQLHIFIPPNYSTLNNPNKSSCYASSSATTTTTSSSSYSSSSQNSNMRIDPTDISLSLWSYNNTTPPPPTTFPLACRQQNSDNLLLSTINMQSPVAGVPVSRPSTFYKLEEPHRNVTDVDTTLHL